MCLYTVERSLLRFEGGVLTTACSGSTSARGSFERAYGVFHQDVCVLEWCCRALGRLSPIGQYLNGILSKPKGLQCGDDLES